MRKRGRRGFVVSVAIYRLLLLAYPREQRARSGEDMVQLFHDTLADAVRQRGLRGFVGMWGEMVWDLVVSVWTERRLGRGEGQRPGGPARKVQEAAAARPARSGMLADLGRDAAIALRTLARSPGFTIVTVLILTMGIGVNAAIFQSLSNVLGRSFSYDEPDRLVWLHKTNPKEGMRKGKFSALALRDLLEASATFEDATLVDWGTATFADESNATVVNAINASSNVFGVLGVTMALGRTFLPREGEAGGNDVVILSHGFWRTRFGADPDAVGRTVRVDGVAVTIVGVLPADFEPPRSDGAGDIWLPLGLASDSPSYSGNWLLGIGRMADGRDLGRAQDEVDGLVPILAQENPEAFGPSEGVRLIGLAEGTWGETGLLLLFAMAAAGLVLLVACANLAGLSLARASGRAREVGVRGALGASRSRIVRLFLVESVLLSMAGGVGGILVALGTGTVLGTYAAGQLPRLTEAPTDLRVMAFALVAAGLCALAFGVWPALKASKVSPREVLQDQGRGSSGSRSWRRLRSALVISQMTVSVVLLITTGLIIRSIAAVMDVDGGFDQEDVLTFELRLPRSDYGSAEAVSAFQDELLERLGALPGVAGVGAVDKRPLGSRWGCSGLYHAEQAAPERDSWPCVESRAGTPGYFQTMGIELIEGRAFDRTDRPDALPVVVVNQTMANAFWPGESPVGKQVRWASDYIDELPWRTVVGVVEDVRHRGLERDALPEVFMPHWQSLDRRMTYVVRLRSGAQGVLPLVRAEIRDMDSGLPLRDARSMADVVSSSLAAPRYTVMLLAVLSLLALGLAVTGAYGALSYLVAQRTRELGVRVALGADPRLVMRMVVRQGVVQALAALALGLPLALFAGRALEAFLFGVSGADATTYGIVTVLLVLVAALASFIPARRAMRVDPVEALREA